MATFDHRTSRYDGYSPSFYVFDNMAMISQNEGGNLHRFDSAQEAAESFLLVQTEHPSWTPALGVHAFDIGGGPHDVDLVHGGKNGACFLVTDYREDSFWDRGDVGDAADKLADILDVEWQTDWNIAGGPALIPYAPHDRSPSPELADMALRPSNPDFPRTSISSALIEGKGWVGRSELREMANAFEAGVGERPKVVSLTVSYEDMRSGRMGDIPISPHDFKGMEDRFQALQLQREQEREAAKAAEERASWPNGVPPLPDTGMPFFDLPDGRGGCDKVNVTVGTHSGTDNLYVGLSVFDGSTGEMRDGPSLTRDIIKLPPFMAAIDSSQCKDAVGFLMDSGLGRLTGQVLHGDEGTYPLFRFDEDKLTQANDFGVASYLLRSDHEAHRGRAGQRGTARRFEETGP